MTEGEAPPDDASTWPFTEEGRQWWDRFERHLPINEGRSEFSNFLVRERLMTEELAKLRDALGALMSAVGNV